MRAHEEQHRTHTNATNERKDELSWNLRSLLRINPYPTQWIQVKREFRRALLRAGHGRAPKGAASARPTETRA